MTEPLSKVARAVVEFSQRRGLFLFLRDKEVAPENNAKERRVIVALSGGPDSCALLLALLEISEAGLLPGPVAAAHFHHGLRGADANQDAAFCAALCARFALPCIIGLGAVPRTGRGNYSNDTARRARYVFLAEAARDAGADAIATAHTADDQAETVLGRVLRGTSVDGLAGIPARAAFPLTTVGDFDESGDFDKTAPAPGLLVIRPLLAVSRREVEEYCAGRGVTPRHDPSNDKEAFPRVRLRRRLPELARDFNPRLGDALRRLSEHAIQDADYLGIGANALWESALLFLGPLSVQMDQSALRDAHPALRRRVLLRALRHVTGETPETAEAAATSDFVSRLETLTLTSVGAVSLPGKGKAQIQNAALLLRRPSSESSESPEPDYAIALPVPADIFVAAAGLRLKMRVEKTRGEELPDVPRSQDTAFAFDTPFALIARPLRSGERIAPLGMGGKTRLVRDLMAEAGWPVADRAAAVVIARADTDESLWVIGLAQAESTRVTPATKRLLHLCAESSC